MLLAVVDGIFLKQLTRSDRWRDDKVNPPPRVSIASHRLNVYTHKPLLTFLNVVSVQ